MMTTPNLLLTVIGACLLSSAHAHIHSRSQKISLLERDTPSCTTWVSALLSAVLVGACGVFPLLLNRWVKLDAKSKDKGLLKIFLGFAVGGLLGDVFLHLLPEAWGSQGEQGQPSGITGAWVIAGLLTFFLVEKMVKCTEREREGEGEEEEARKSANLKTELHTVNGFVQNGGPRNGFVKQNGGSCNGFVQNGGSYNGFVQNGGSCSGAVLRRHPINGTPAALPPPPPPSPTPPPLASWKNKDISGYLNLVANCTDNFTHGLAIAASYIASPTVGLLTTLAILCHELPHEIGDFAILLKSGFDSWTAAKAQMVTACGGLVGVCFGLSMEHISSSASWMLPFTAGGFLYIALVSIVPDLLQDHCRPLEGVAQLIAIVLGIVVMAMVTIIEKKSCSQVPIMLELQESSVA